MGEQVKTQMQIEISNLECCKNAQKLSFTYAFFRTTVGWGPRISSNSAKWSKWLMSTESTLRHSSPSVDVAEVLSLRWTPSQRRSVASISGTSNATRARS